MTPPNKPAIIPILSRCESDRCDAVDEIEDRLDRDEKDIDVIRVRADAVYGIMRHISEVQLPQVIQRFDKLESTLASKIDDARAESLNTAQIVRMAQKYDIEPLQNQIKEIGKQAKSIKPIQTVVLVQGLGTLIVVILVLLLFLR